MLPYTRASIFPPMYLLDVELFVLPLWKLEVQLLRALKRRGERGEEERGGVMGRAIIILHGNQYNIFLLSYFIYNKNYLPGGESPIQSQPMVAGSNPVWCTSNLHL